MYAAFFGLQQEAFSIAPDPRFLHLSTAHREALAHLVYGLQGGGGFVLLTGEIGTGKTTVCRCFLEQLPPHVRVAYVVHPKLTPPELLQTVCEEFGITVRPGQTVKPFVDALNGHLLEAHARGEQCLLVVDEAQGLSTRLLEQLRLLTNLETSSRKLLQIMLIGQPELRDKLARPELEQLAQRVIARVHLGPLSEPETADYVRHRLAVAGGSGEGPFDRRALAALHRLSRGVPRRINLLAQRALLGAYGQGRRQVDAALVRRAAAEVLAEGPPTLRWPLVGVTAGAVVAIALAAWLWPHVPASPTAASAPAGASSASASPAPLPVPWPGERALVQAMASAWGVGDVGASDCDGLRGAGLACAHGQADWALLQRLDRPVGLDVGDGRWLLLRGLGGGRAQVQGSDGQAWVDRARLQGQWTGRYVALWRTPPGWIAGAERATAESADWTLERLAALQGEAVGRLARQSRDEAFRQRVFAFQVANGLPLDGVAGPLTLMLVNRASGVDEPRLAQEP